MKRLLAVLCLLSAGLEASPPKALIRPRLASPVIHPLVRPLVLFKVPLFQVACSSTGSSGSCGGAGGGGLGIAYQTIQEETVALTQRSTVNFTGTGVSCVDNAGATRTDCTITAGSGSPGGANTEVQFNDGGAFGGDAGLTYVKATDTLSVGTISLGGFASTITSSADAVFRLGGTGTSFTVRPTAGTNNSLILAGSESDSVTAGNAQVFGGEATGTATAAGFARIVGGSAEPAGVAGGDASALGGSAFISGGAGGAVRLTGGSSSGSGTAGSVFLHSGSGGSGTDRGIVLNGTLWGGANTLTVSTAGSLVAEGSSADANETTVAFANPTAATTWTMPALAVGSYQFTGQSGSLTSTHVPFTNSSGVLVGDSDLSFATDTLSATKVESSTWGKAAFFGPVSGTAASAGTFRLANNTKACWRNAANSADLCLWYDGSDVFNMDGTGAGTLWDFTAIAAPATPAAGHGSVYVDSTSKNLSVKDDAGVVKHGIQTKTCTAGDFVSAVSDAGVATCTTPTGGLDINGLTAEPLINPFDDTLPYYDSSAAANRKIGMGGLGVQLGRTYWSMTTELLYTPVSPFNGNGVGSGGVGYQSTEASHIGYNRASTGTTTTGMGEIGSTAAVGVEPPIILGSGRVHFKAWIRPGATLSDGTDTFTLVIGLGNCTSGSACVISDGVYFEYAHDVNSGKWRGKCVNDSSVTNVDDTGSAVAGSTWYGLDLEVNSAASSAEFWVNETSIGTCGTNVPTGSGDLVGPQVRILKSAGTSNRVVDIDAISVIGEYATAR